MDTHTVQVIRRGIEIDTKHGCTIAWAHMAAHGVPPETILRVLTKPQARRAADERVDGDATPPPANGDQESLRRPS